MTNAEKCSNFALATPRDGAVVARWAHNPKVRGSSPLPATNLDVSLSVTHPFSFISFYIQQFFFFISKSMEVLYEDNHIIVVNKAAGEIVQGDKTGDTPLSEIVKAYLKEKYNKPGNVFCGVVHRIDRPVSGAVIFAKTSKALTRLNEMLRKNEIHKTYYALVEGHPAQEEATLENFAYSHGGMNKSFICDAKHPDAKKCILHYKTIAKGDRYSILEINLITGRKHQIRLQLSNIGHPIKGDLKYGAKRSNPDGGISLLAKRIEFIHPVSKQPIHIEVSPTPEMQKILH